MKQGLRQGDCASRTAAGRAPPRAAVYAASRPYGDHRTIAATPKIRLFINYEHIALVMRVRREMGYGESFR